MNVIICNSDKTRFRELKVGFCWWTFIFGSLALILMRITGWAIIAITIELTMFLAERNHMDTFLVPIQLLCVMFRFYIGINGNKFRAQKYFSEGWRFSEPDSIQAKYAKQKWELEYVRDSEVKESSVRASYSESAKLAKVANEGLGSITKHEINDKWKMPLIVFLGMTLIGFFLYMALAGNKPTEHNNENYSSFDNKAKSSEVSREVVIDRAKDELKEEGNKPKLQADAPDVRVLEFGKPLISLMKDSNLRDIQSYWGYGIVAHLTNWECPYELVDSNEYKYHMFEDVPATRVKDGNNAWRIQGDRAITMAGCWSKVDDTHIKYKVIRKKDGFVVEDQLGVEEDAWVVAKQSDPFIVLQDLPLADRNNPSKYPWVGHWASTQSDCSGPMVITYPDVEDSSGEGSCKLKKITKTGEWFGLRSKCKGENGETEYNVNLRVIDNTLIQKRGEDLQLFVRCGSGVPAPQYRFPSQQVATPAQNLTNNSSTLQQGTSPNTQITQQARKDGLEAQYENPIQKGEEQNKLFIEKFKSQNSGQPVFGCNETFGIDILESFTDVDVLISIQSGGIVRRSEILPLEMLGGKSQITNMGSTYSVTPPKYSWKICSHDNQLTNSCLQEEFVIDQTQKKGTLYTKDISNAQLMDSIVTKRPCKRLQ